MYQIDQEGTFDDDDDYTTGVINFSFNLVFRYWTEEDPFVDIIFLSSADHWLDTTVKQCFTKNVSVFTQYKITPLNSLKNLIEAFIKQIKIYT